MMCMTRFSFLFTCMKLELHRILAFDTVVSIRTGSPRSESHSHHTDPNIHQNKFIKDIDNERNADVCFSHPLEVRCPSLAPPSWTAPTKVSSPRLVYFITIFSAPTCTPSYEYFAVIVIDPPSI
ncbi:uncharacterized protein BJ212DRAFT_1406835 [Suillus subaureus]|uniref:Uncharacterized protein n=1 Tax=Suillus subaureus TaxID=48587 RepID=A0A9P7IXM1_9AGAM|nr:uncharacterized protein BJ212DRAFT_1406835 [Suillus subaureus]KAG1797156.1 hypothetical protein BJ212DRAFT_1406835 [Suillus subaureus]